LVQRAVIAILEDVNLIRSVTKVFVTQRQTVNETALVESAAHALRQAGKKDGLREGHRVGFRLFAYPEDLQTRVEQSLMATVPGSFAESGSPDVILYVISVVDGLLFGFLRATPALLEAWSGRQAARGLKAPSREGVPTVPQSEGVDGRVGGAVPCRAAWKLMEVFRRCPDLSPSSTRLLAAHASLLIPLCSFLAHHSLLTPRFSFLSVQRSPGRVKETQSGRRSTWVPRRGAGAMS
jgi:hypothetical protein